MLSEFKLARLFVIKSLPPEKILLAGTLVPIKIKKFIKINYILIIILEKINKKINIYPESRDNPMPFL